MNIIQLHLGKRVLAPLLALLLLLPLILACFSGCAAKYTFVLSERTLPENGETLKYSTFRYRVYNDDTIIITEYKGDAEEVVIPDTIDGKKVVALENNLFYQQKSLKSIRLGSYIERIGTQCFTECSFLESVEMGKSVWSIGAFAFAGTPWLDNLENPPKENTGNETTAESTAETTAETTKKDPSKDFLIVGDGVLLRYLGDEKNIIIPDNVHHIADAFLMRDIVSVKMSDSVYSIGEYSFAFCASLATIDFSPNLLTIGENAFYGCSTLPSVVFPNQLRQLGACAFYQCENLTSVRLSPALTLLDDGAFFNCTQLRMVQIPKTLTALGVEAFGSCPSIELVFYEGTEEEFKKINLDATNYIILDATIVYNVAKQGQ
jgi:hypothetical protein